MNEVGTRMGLYFGLGGESNNSTSFPLSNLKGIDLGILGLFGT